MKGLMVSLIIVLIVGTTSKVLSAGQQDAAGVESSFGLHSIVARPLERPGPDDSDIDDDVDWPSPTSRLSRDSTNTSQSVGDLQYGAPAPDSVMDQDIRFDVKVSKNAVQQLRQGLKVFSPVQVKDRSDTLLDPSVVSDIALFLDTNSGRQDLRGVRLDPQPMEPNSTTLTFEIPAAELDRIEEDAFLFSVPDSLRGKFDRVEFVAGPAGSHEFSSGMTVGSRGSATGPEAINRSGANQADRFGTSNESQGWNFKSADTPQPGPGVAPGERNYVGPYIDPAELRERENRLARLNSNDKFSNQLDLNREPLNTGGRFQTADQRPEVGSNQSPFGLPQANRNPSNQNQNNFRQNTNPSANEQRYQESFAEQQLRVTQKQLADAEADKKLLQQNASNLMRQAEYLSKQKDDLSQQLQTVNDREFSNQPANFQQTDFADRYLPNRSFINQTVDVAKNLTRPFSFQRDDFRAAEPVYSGRTQTEVDQQKLIAEQQRQIEFQNSEKLRLQTEKLAAENRLANAQGLPERRPTYDSSYQPTSYKGPGRDESQFRINGQGPDGPFRTADASSIDARPNRAARDFAEVPFETENTRQGLRTDRGNGGRLNGDRVDAKVPLANTNSKSSSDLIWLLPLLLGSLALNFFLWVHSRSLYMRYSDLADELRGMVSATTI